MWHIKHLIIIRNPLTITSTPRHQYHPESFSSRVDTGCDTERAISYYVYHILKHEKVLYYELWRRRSHVINIILRGMTKGWWYRYQSRQSNTVVMFFQYYICKFPLLLIKKISKGNNSNSFKIFTQVNDMYLRRWLN
jgi:hypothetical protein